MSSLIDTSVISFYVSILGIIGMITFKLVEIRSGKKAWFFKIIDSKNHIMHDFFVKMKKHASYINRKSAIALIQWIAYHILSWARKTYIWAYKKAHAHPPSKKVIDMVRGKGEIKKTGGASFYLKRISENDESEMKK
jgi:hypothetical protein